MKFKSRFLKEQFELGNISDISLGNIPALRVGVSSLLKNKPLNKHPKKYKDRITSYLRKEGYMYNEILDIYVNRKYTEE